MNEEPKSSISGKGVAKVKPNLPLPSITDLYNDVEWAARQNDLNRLLNQEPSPKWIKEHPFIKNIKYIPIERIEWLLTNIFLSWWCEVKEVKVIANSVNVTVRLWVIDPITGQEIFNDGVGAVDIQTKKDAPVTDFNQIIPFAVMKSVPAAKSYAIKDAAESFGKLFGKDLNRKDFVAYTNLDGKFDFDTIQANQDQTLELYRLVNAVSLDNDVRDEFIFRIQKGVSITEYHMIKDELINLQASSIERLRNGESISQKDIKKAVADKLDDPEA